MTSRITPSRRVLDLPRAFYGLARGRLGLCRTSGSPAAKDRCPRTRSVAELIVGFFDLERATGFIGTADEFNEKIQSVVRRQQTNAAGVSHVRRAARPNS